MKIWKCGVCGYLHDGEEAPENCPKCGAPREKFEALTPEATELVSKSRRTNDIHMEVAVLLDRVYALSQEGSDINLDPGCKGIFERAKSSAHTLRQQIKAEVQAHMNKGKWG
jgi:hypothetical protein